MELWPAAGVVSVVVLKAWRVAEWPGDRALSLSRPSNLINYQIRSQVPLQVRDAKICSCLLITSLMKLTQS